MNTYCFANFEVKDFSSSCYESNIRNTLARLRNNLLWALNKTTVLPKLIVVVLDDDLTKGATGENASYSSINKTLDWLLKQFERWIAAALDNFPQKAKCPNYLHVLWMAPPTHRYFTESSNKKCIKTADSLSTLVRERKNMSSLHMIKIWDHDDHNAFVYEANRFTTDGLFKYWASIDSAVRFWNVAVFPKMGS